MSGHIVRCIYCGPLAAADGIGSGSQAAVAHTDETGHMVISEPADPPKRRVTMRKYDYSDHLDWRGQQGLR
jgi:hypothetical protein